MKGLPKHSLSKVLCGIAVILLFHFNLSAFIFFNNSEICFNQASGYEGEIAVLQCETLRCHVIDGAGYFLDSHADVIRLLQALEVGELSGLDYNRLRFRLDSAIEHLLAAQNTYSKLKQTADLIPYDSLVLDQLLNFNYDVFRAENHLLEPIFERVRFFLCNGAVRELYGEVLTQIERILVISYEIKAKIDIGEYPGLSDLYKLNDSYSESLLFGEYAARVFREIKRM